MGKGWIIDKGFIALMKHANEMVRSVSLRRVIHSGHHDGADIFDAQERQNFLAVVHVPHGIHALCLGVVVVLPKIVLI